MCSNNRTGMDDAWCLDQRGLLTLSLTKETYQQLGLVGVPESRKEKERFSACLSHTMFLSNDNLTSVVVEIDLYDRTSKIFTRAKEAFRLWDDRRRAQGVDEWEVVCYLANGAHLMKFSAIPRSSLTLHRLRLDETAVRSSTSHARY